MGSSGRPPDYAAIARESMVAPTVVLTGRVDLDQYPHRHLILGEVAVRASRLLLPTLLAAVEAVADCGWELITVLRVDDALICAVMRRRDPVG